MELRKQLNEKPTEVKRYEIKLRKAIFAHNKAEAAAAKKRASAKKLFHKAETEFERTLEYLSEIISADSSLNFWFDRQLDFSAAGSLGANPIEIPRVITSRSLDASAGGLMLAKLSKRQVKIAAVQAAITEFECSDVNNSIQGLRDIMERWKKFKLD